MHDRIPITPAISRRRFLARCGQGLCGLMLGSCLSSCREHELYSATATQDFIRPARHWRSIPDGSVQCQLCPNQCFIENGGYGRCRTRKNIDGRLHTIVYARIAAMHHDPIEKKPLFHFLPGSTALSIATAGCNLSCQFCQNWQISQAHPDDIVAVRITGQGLVQKAQSMRSRVIAYTYNEPSVQFEYIVDSAQLAKTKGLRPVIISNGYIRPAAGRELAKNLDAIKIDLKAFTEKFYTDICGGGLKSVLANMEAVHSMGKWMEIVVLILPTLNDSADEIKQMSSWVRKHLGQNVPMHFTRFHAMYKIRNLPPTPVKTLERCCAIARDQGIRYTYIGNVPGHSAENTYCHSCGRLIIKRGGYFNIKSTVTHGRCPYCHTAIPGVWT